MKRLMVPFLMVAGLSACIFYEDTDEDWDDELPWECPNLDDPDIGCADIDDPDVDDPQDDPQDDPPPEFTLSMDPGEAEQGDMFIAHLSAEGDLDVRDIANIYVGGGVSVLVTLFRDGEVVFMMEVDEQAETGEVDMVLDMEDGTVVVFDAALTVYEAGSGHSAEECD